MEPKKVAVLLRKGLPYKRTILYGYRRARELGAKLLLIGVVPRLDNARMLSMALCEVAPYDALSKQIERESFEFLEWGIQFCLDKGITVESRMEAGGLDVAMKRASEDKEIRLVVIPTPTNDEHHREFLSAIKHFAHDVFDHELRCPIVSVVST
jgi:hypothetical protein